MDKSEGIKILKQLADGIDPYTGEVFPEDSPKLCLHMDTVIENQEMRYFYAGKP
jgi:hypothetical protein